MPKGNLDQNLVYPLSENTCPIESCKESWLGIQLCWQGNWFSNKRRSLSLVEIQITLHRFTILFGVAFHNKNVIGHRLS
jgi:hypothetical protein